MTKAYNIGDGLEIIVGEGELKLNEYILYKEFEINDRIMAIISGGELGVEVNGEYIRLY